jgi:integrase
MVYSFARIGAAVGMRVEDVYTQNRRLWLRLHEKGGKQHAMPCHHNLESYLHAYTESAGLAGDPKALLFQTYRCSAGLLTGNPLPQANAYAMIQRRARGPRSRPRSATIRFALRASPPTLRTAGRLNAPRRWRTTPARGRRSSMIAALRK